MRLLLDTHAWLWWLTDDRQLPQKAREAIQSSDNEVFISAVTAMELSTKQRLGKLPQAEVVVRDFHDLVSADGFKHLAINHAHALRAGSHPAEHRDPFDRLLAAQSELEAMTLVSRDPAFAQFGIHPLW